MTREVRLDLLEDASETGDWHLWPGGKGLFFSEGSSFDVQLEIMSPNGKAISVEETAANSSEDSAVKVELPPGRVRAKVNSGSAIYAYLVTIPAN